MTRRFAAGRYVPPHPVRVGDVYPSFGTGPQGPKRGTLYWLVISVTSTSRYGGATHLLGLDKDWNIVSTTSYGVHVMAERPRLFRIKNVEQLRLTKEPA